MFKVGDLVKLKPGAVIELGDISWDLSVIEFLRSKSTYIVKDYKYFRYYEPKADLKREEVILVFDGGIEIDSSKFEKASPKTTNEIAINLLETAVENHCEGAEKLSCLLALELIKRLIGGM